jgi:hypothetical protein
MTFKKINMKKYMSFNRFVIKIFNLSKSNKKVTCKLHNAPRVIQYYPND